MSRSLKTKVEDLANYLWETLSSKTVYESPWLKLRLDKVKLPNGMTIDDYSVVEMPKVAVVVAITETGNVVLVKQYRYANNKVLVELPAGTFDPNKEPAKEAAIRELWEETGYKAADMIQLGEMYEYATKLKHSVVLFLAKNIKYDPIKHADETEDITLLEIPFKDAVEAVRSGEICVAGSVTALLLANDYLTTQELTISNTS